MPLGKIHVVEGRHPQLQMRRGRMVLPVPPSITVEMAKGCTFYMVKAVMGGRSEDIISRQGKPLAVTA